MQLLIGVATGLLVVVVTSPMGDAGGRGIVSLGSANAVAAFSFAVGFFRIGVSEACVKARWRGTQPGCRERGAGTSVDLAAAHALAALNRSLQLLNQKPLMAV